MELKLATKTYDQIRMTEIAVKGTHTHLIETKDLSSGRQAISIKPKPEECRGGECSP